MIKETHYWTAVCDGCRNNFRVAPQTEMAICDELRKAKWQIEESGNCWCNKCVEIFKKMKGEGR